jgi:NAD(P)-dependent dehydrogenase (short-subunit alcohol dehydrogenase family)
MSEQDMRGKVALITGGTNGIGRAAALGLAKLGAEVVIVGRDAAKTARVVGEIARDSRNKMVSGVAVDLSRRAEVARLAAEFKTRHERLDVLINNAGCFFGPRFTTADGYEMTFALNYLAYFKLTGELLELLKRSAPARIINVSSGAQRMGKIDFDDLMGERRYSGQQAYNQSKLADVMFTAELARRLAGTGVTANALHPGIVRTNFGLENPSTMMKIIVAVAKPFMLTPEKGADTAVWLATSPEVAGVSGKYFSSRKEAGVNKLVRDQAACERLWKVSEQLTA